MQESGMEGKVLEALRELAGAVDQTAETLWPMAVEATWAKSITSVAISGFLLLFMFAAAPVAWKMAKRFPDEDRMVFTRVVTGVLCLLVFVISMVGIETALPGLIAPEGITLFELLK